MTNKDSLVERLETYLDEYEGLTPLPDAVRNGIRAELLQTKQIGPIRGLSRILRMSMQLPAQARYGLVAVIGAVAVIIGASLLMRGGSVGGPSASPAPSANASPSLGATPSLADTPLPSPTAPTGSGPWSLVEVRSEGDLTPGTYYIDTLAIPNAPIPARVFLDVPAGWWYYWPGETPALSDVQAILVDNGVGSGQSSAWGLAFTVVDRVLVDPCDSSAGFMDAAVTESVDTLAAAFSSWADYPVVSVSDVAVGEYPAKRLEVERRSGCDGILFYTPSGFDFRMQVPSTGPQVNQFTLVDVGGSVLVIWTTDFPGSTTFEEGGGAEPDPKAHLWDQGALRWIVDSISIQPL